MNNVNFEGSEAKLQLNKDFYSKEAVERTLEAFSSFNIDAGESEDEIQVTIHGREDVGIEKAAYQFLNYLLSEMKKGKSPEINL